MDPLTFFNTLKTALLDQLATLMPSTARLDYVGVGPKRAISIATKPGTYPPARYAVFFFFQQTSLSDHLVIFMDYGIKNQIPSTKTARMMQGNDVAPIAATISVFLTTGDLPE